MAVDIHQCGRKAAEMLDEKAIMLLYRGSTVLWNTVNMYL
jgi:hypothetical protein